MKSLYKTILVSIFFSGLFLLFPEKSFAATLNVGVDQAYVTIDAALDAASNGDTINIVDPVITETSITVTTGKTITIQGQGTDSTIVQATTSYPGSAVGRIFNIEADTVVTLRDMTIRYGYVSNGGGSGIYNQGNLTLDSVRVTQNQDYSGWGGAGLFNWGGFVTIADSLFDDNHGGFAAAIRNNGDMAIGYSTFTSNTANTWAGGVYLMEGTVLITNSTFYDNEGGTYGGGAMRIIGDEVTIVNSTISGNSAANGGGLLIDPFDAIVRLVNTTVADNTASSNGQGLYIHTSVEGPGSLLFVLFNTIIANGSTDNAYVTGTGEFNLARVYTILQDATLSVAGDGNLNSTDPLLGALADNGGKTLTHAIDADSPAYNAGAAAWSTLTAPAIDQRDESRYTDAPHDIGAYEYIAPDEEPEEESPTPEENQDEGDTDQQENDQTEQGETESTNPNQGVTYFSYNTDSSNEEDGSESAQTTDETKETNTDQEDQNLEDSNVDESPETMQNESDSNLYTKIILWVLAGGSFAAILLWLIKFLGLI